MIKKWVKVTLSNKTVVEGDSIRIDKKNSLILISGKEKLFESHKVNTIEEVGTRTEVDYIPMQNVLYWQKGVDNKVDKNES
jgi:hypothetical protein